ncbi:hypothetical protein QFC19_003184 [Naganishia cerealis]|uniref:Uncharacterized protein n=1 Tax=Naganishia cerealis TaxID=610337 RepID=A0ACC2W5H8_9TREE|nr:hypothetical protein QFC19_003184 [Naganishia cerealis]
MEHILEGVKRMREEYGDGESEGGGQGDKSEEAQQNHQNQQNQQNHQDHQNQQNHQNHQNHQKEQNQNHVQNQQQSRDRIQPHRRRPAPQSYSAVQVSNSQKGNPLLNNSLMKTTPWSFNGSILSDYYINASVQILFLSLKYHKVHPEYIWQRLKKLHRGSSVSSRSDNSLRVLLVVVDIDAYNEVLRKLADLCIKQDLSLVLAWSFEEAGNYIAYAKQYETSASNATSAIRGIKSQDYRAAVVETLTSVPAVNKTDVVNLLANFHSFHNVVKEGSNGTKLGDILGMGSRKVENMKRVFTEPFIYNKEYGRTELN